MEEISKLTFKTGKIIQGLEKMDKLSGNSDYLDVFLILCAIIFFSWDTFDGGSTGIKDRS